MKKITTIALALSVSLLATSAAHAITTSNVTSNITGTIKSHGTSVTEKYRHEDGIKRIVLANGLGTDSKEYNYHSNAIVRGKTKSQGQFTGGSQYQIVGNTVVGNSWENKTIDGFSKQKTDGYFYQRRIWC